MIFDTHAHYDDSRFDEDREAVLTSLSCHNVSRVVNVAADMDSVRTTLALADKYDFIYAAIGVHPDGIAEMTEADIETLRALSAHEKVVAVGECGLDYYGREIPRETQIHWFSRQLALAKECDLPVIVHSRDAAEDTYETVKRFYTGDGAGIIHCFSYGKEMARQFLDLGYYIALGGVVTFKNSKKAKEVAAYVPEDRLLIETDCPYLAPVPKRGTRNDSGNLGYVLDTMAELRGVSREHIERATYENACRLYRLKV